MKRGVVSGLLIALPACSSAPADHASLEGLGVERAQQIDIDVAPRDRAELGQCATQSADPELVRCGDPDAVSNAVTVCGALVANDAMTVKSGSLVVGGDSRISAAIRVGRGSFVSFGGIVGNGNESIDGDLTTSSNWVVGGPARVGGDAFVGGRLEAREPVRVGGTLHVEGPVSGAVHAGSTTRTGGDGAKSLSCAGAPAVQAIADAAEREGATNEDEALASVSRRTDMTLGCGRYRFASLGVGAPLSLHVDGNVVVVVDGDARVAAPMHVDVHPGASLDVVIRGELDIDDTLAVDGAPAWLAVGSDVRIASPTIFRGWLVAPGGEIEVNAPLDAGALYVASLTAESPVTVDGSANGLRACTPALR
jgi:hypothetical protein